MEDAVPAVLTKEKAAELVEWGRLDDITENYVFPDSSDDEDEKWPLIKVGSYARTAMSPKRRISPLLFGKDASDYQANKMRLRRQGQIASDDEDDPCPAVGRGRQAPSTCPDVRLQQLAAATFVASK